MVVLALSTLLTCNFDMSKMDCTVQDFDTFTLTIKGVITDLTTFVKLILVLRVKEARSGVDLPP